MYQAKAAGGSRFAVYNQSMHASLVERVRMERDLASALDNDEFVLHYQPLIDLKSGRIQGVEALVRWLHPERGLIGPDSFIPLAESTGLISRLGLWVLRASCEQMTSWHRSSPAMRSLQVSVNVSAHQLLDPRLFGHVRDILADTGLQPSCLTLEMTESGLLDDSDEVHSNLLALHEIGVRLAIDDFGTGYSSLSYLHRFPVDILKIDRSFVERLSSSGEVGLIGTIIQLGRTMNLETVAEGIEHAKEMLILRREGCNTGQGFHFSPPVTPTQLTGLIHAQRDAGIMQEEDLPA
jgi:EAL domain-containing protein (putative c-di-GMP-specific phosphodiesterase class I)